MFVKVKLVFEDHIGVEESANRNDVRRGCGQGCQETRLAVIVLVNPLYLSPNLGYLLNEQRMWFEEVLAVFHHHRRFMKHKEGVN
jgi:hypothetical protein